MATKKPAPEADKRRLEILEKLGTTVAAKRKQAIDGRQASGIEQIWIEDQEFYDGYDDANRHEFVESARKPTEGGQTAAKKKAKGCILFPNITAPYVDAAAAKVADMLLPTDDRNFVIEPTPVPDILDDEEGWPEVVVPQPAPQAGPSGAALPLPAGMPGVPVPAGLPQPGAPASPAAALMQAPAQAAGLAPPQDPEAELAALFEKIKALKAKAEAAAKLMQDKVDDDLTECGYHTELRDMIDDASRLGTGVMKGPVAEKREYRVWAKNPKTGERELVVKVETKPASRRISVWDGFPDYPACGDDIHRGSFFLEREFFPRKMLRDLKGGVGPSAYLDSEIDKVLKEGPNKRTATAGRGYEQQGDDKDVFELWRFYGAISGEELQAAGCQCDDPDKQYNVILTVVNDTVIKAARNPLDSGEFPFDFMPWKKRPGMPWGAGVGRQGRTAQRITTAALRNLMDNAGASAKPHKVVTDDIEQAEDPWTWRPASDSNVNDVRTAMMFFVQPSLQPEMLNIITMGERMMELHTGLPMIILGLQGNVEETAHGRALQNNNGATVLRRTARNFDGRITEPHIKRHVQFNMLYAEDDTLKGDFQVKARGSSALVERDLQNQQLPTLLNASLQPAYGLDPELAMEEFLKSQKFSPKAFQLTEKKKEEIAKRQPPPPYQVQVAQIKDKGETDRMNAEHEHKAQMEKMRQQFDGSQSEADRQMKRMLADIDARLRMADLSSEERQHLETQKVLLAKVNMELSTQKELFVGSARMDMHKHSTPAMTQVPQVATPGTEPPQRAPDGQGFVQ